MNFYKGWIANLDKEKLLIDQFMENRHIIRDIEYRLNKIEQLLRRDTRDRNSLFHMMQEPAIAVKKTKKLRPKAKKGEDIRNDLLGRLTTLLIKPKFFPSNSELVYFSQQHLGIKVPNWQKRSRREIIGVIIEEVYTLPPLKIEKFYRAASKIQEKATKGDIDDFFGAWQSIISSLKLR